LFDLPTAKHEHKPLSWGELIQQLATPLPLNGKALALISAD
jgi:hypothetical protein